MTHVHTMMCGACSVENALKVAFYTYRKFERGNSIKFTQSEIDTVMCNAPPGSPTLSVLSFKVRVYASSCNCCTYFRYLVPINSSVLKYKKIIFEKCYKINKL